MKKFILIFVCFLSLQLFAQETVTLLVSSDGPSKEEAIKNALRSAIEQTYGAFVSSNTTILNDELVKNDIITISSGNVTSFDIVSSATLPNGSAFVTLSATISPSNLITYAQSKGAECQLSTSTYLMNLKLKKLNELNTRLAIANLFPQLKELSRYMYDYALDTKIKQVDERNEIATLEITISILVNKNAKTFSDFLRSNLKAISERSSGGHVRLQFFDVRDCCSDLYYIHSDYDWSNWMSRYENRNFYHSLDKYKAPEEYYNAPLTEHQFNMLSVIFDDALYNFEVIDNMGNKYFLPIMSQIVRKYDTNLYVDRILEEYYYKSSNKKKIIDVNEIWNWENTYEYAAEYFYYFTTNYRIPYEFSVNKNGIINIPYVLYNGEQFESNSSSSVKIGERKVEISIPLETFANLTNMKIEACGNQYDNILERVCEINVVNKHRYMNFADLGLPSGTKWAKEDAYAAPIVPAMYKGYGSNIPTHIQFQELMDNCTFTLNGSSVKVIGPNGNEILFKLGGIRDISGIWDESTIGKTVLYWSRAFDKQTGKYYVFGFKKNMQTNQIELIKLQKEDPIIWHNIRLVL